MDAKNSKLYREMMDAKRRYESCAYAFEQAQWGCPHEWETMLALEQGKQTPREVLRVCLLCGKEEEIQENPAC